LVSPTYIWCTRVYPKVSRLSHNKIYTACCSPLKRVIAAKLTRLAHKIVIYTTAPNGRELYHLQFLLQVASPEILGYTLIRFPDSVSHFYDNGCWTSKIHDSHFMLLTFWSSTDSIHFTEITSLHTRTHMHTPLWNTQASLYKVRSNIDTKIRF
jgi:hypothetical protein